MKGDVKMKCPICGADAAEIEFKAGKGKFNVKAAIVGGLLTGGIGAVAGFKDRIATKGYIACRGCGYDQFLSVDPSLVLETEKMEQIEQSIYYPFDISLNEVLGKITQNANEQGIVVRARLDEVNRAPGGQALASYPCLIIEHPDHPVDYLKFCIQKNVDGNRCMFTPYVFGCSTQIQMKNYNDSNSGQSAGGLAIAALEMLGGGKKAVMTGYGFGSEVGKYVSTSIIKSINNSKMDACALQWEQIWYGEVSNVISSVLA